MSPLYQLSPLLLKTNQNSKRSKTHSNELSKQIWLKAADDQEALTLQNIFVTMFSACSIYMFRVMSGRDNLD